MRKPQDFIDHPSGYEHARSIGCFRVKVTHVTDGDTFDCFIDLGMGKYAYETVRLFNIDTAEIFSPKSEAERVHGLAAKARVEALIASKGCLIRTWQDKETFGRYVAQTYYPMYNGVTNDHVWIDLRTTLLAEGFAKKDQY